MQRNGVARGNEMLAAMASDSIKKKIILLVRDAAESELERGREKERKKNIPNTLTHKTTINE